MSISFSRAVSQRAFIGAHNRCVPNDTKHGSTPLQCHRQQQQPWLLRRPDFAMIWNGDRLRGWIIFDPSSITIKKGSIPGRKTREWNPFWWLQKMEQRWFNHVEGMRNNLGVRYFLPKGYLPKVVIWIYENSPGKNCPKWPEVWRKMDIWKMGG